MLDSPPPNHSRIPFDIREHVISCPNPYVQLLETVTALTVTLGKNALAVANDLHKKLFLYILGSFGIVTAGWILNILGYKNLLLLTIPVFILSSALVMYRANMLAPILLGSLLYHYATAEEITMVRLREAFEAFLLVVCSIIYSATWPLIALTWVSFENAPSSFWGIYTGLFAFALSGWVFSERNGEPPGITTRISRALLNYMFVANPRKLIFQFLVALVKGLAFIS